MNVDQLDQVIKGITSSTDTKKYLRTISHWIKRIKESGEYTVYDEKEKSNIMRLIELKLVDAKEKTNSNTLVIIVTLSESGQELYKDFFRTGYFLKA